MSKKDEGDKVIVFERGGAVFVSIFIQQEATLAIELEYPRLVNTRWL